jgi:acyl dehydratase
MNQLSERYLEDFAVGQTFGSGRLRIEGERALASQGLIKLRTTTLNQHDEAVLVYVVNMVVQRRKDITWTIAAR